MQIPFILFLIVMLTACQFVDKEQAMAPVFNSSTQLRVLGTVQDAGYPQIGCLKACCKEHWTVDAQKHQITCLGLVDILSKQSWMFEASPDFKYQTKKLSDSHDKNTFKLPEGVFITHAHIGHYVGLMHLGREAMSADRVAVYALPQLKKYLEESGPWSQLVALQNIELHPLSADSTIHLNQNLKVTPFLVPHRGEYSETAGYRIEGPHKSVLFIPDIDKWHLWKRDIVAEIEQVDLAFLDATFFKNGEVGNRDMSEIPHPFVEESMLLLDAMSATQKAKIYFIHFNHTNPLLIDNSPAQQEVVQKGFNIAQEGMIFDL